MPFTASRAVLRQSQFLVRRTALRHNSSTSEATAKVKQTASNVTSKASEGLSKVTSSAGPAIAGAAQGVGNALRKVGGPVGRFASFVETLIPPTIYYSRVGLELAKLVARGQKMAPPSLSTFQSFYQPLISAIRNPSMLRQYVTTPQQFLARVRNMDIKELAFVGVTAAEVIGFFTVGEILGRRKLVGYQGTAAHSH